MDRERSAVKVDRDKTCPFLLRVFVRQGGHHTDSEFGPSRLPTSDEHQIYTWKDATLKDLVVILRDVAPTLRGPLSRFSLRWIYWDNMDGRYISKPVGTVHSRDLTRTSDQPVGGGRRYNDENKTLDELRFVVGDFLDVAYLTGSTSGPGGPSGLGGGPGAGPRGFGAGGFGGRGGPLGSGSNAIGGTGRRQSDGWGTGGGGGGGGSRREVDGDWRAARAQGGNRRESEGSWGRKRDRSASPPRRGDRDRDRDRDDPPRRRPTPPARDRD